MKPDDLERITFCLSCEAPIPWGRRLCRRCDEAIKASSRPHPDPVVEPPRPTGRWTRLRQFLRF